MNPSRVVTLTSDFGLSDHFVGTMKGVILGIAPGAKVVDISHAVPAYDIFEGAMTIASAYSYFPRGTVHVVVVDPGVGTSRRPIVAVAEDHVFVAPDNGVLSLIYEREGAVRVYQLTEKRYFLPDLSQTFHGRDVFAPVAAHLVNGVGPAQLGPEIHDQIRLPFAAPEVVAGRHMRGRVIKTDRFGNLITNMKRSDFAALLNETAQTCLIKVGEFTIAGIASSYAEGAPAKPIALFGSTEFLEIAVNQGSAAELLEAGSGTEVQVVPSL